MDRKLKGIPVYAIVLILVSGTALGAGIWFLTVDVPVDYDEPVEVYMWNERDDTETQFGGEGADFRLRDRHEHEEELDMTYETFHQYVKLENPNDGKENLEVTVSLEAQDTDGEATEDIGFVVLEGDVDPLDIDDWEWDEPDNWRASYDDTWNDVVREETEITFDLDEPPEEQTYTVIYTNREQDEDGDPIDVDGYNIEWFFEDTTED